MSTTKRRYAEIEDGPLGEKKLRRVLVVESSNELGHVEWATRDCSGCSEFSEWHGSTIYYDGCSECGYTGKRRVSFFVPFWCYDRWRFCGKGQPWQKTPAPREAVAA